MPRDKEKINQYWALKEGIIPMIKKPNNDKKPKNETKSRQKENISTPSFKNALLEMIKDNELKAILIGSLIVALIFLLS